MWRNSTSTSRPSSTNAPTKNYSSTAPTTCLKLKARSRTPPSRNFSKQCTLLMAKCLRHWKNWKVTVRIRFLGSRSRKWPLTMQIQICTYPTSTIVTSLTTSSTRHPQFTQVTKSTRRLSSSIHLRKMWQNFLTTSHWRQIRVLWVKNRLWITQVLKILDSWSHRAHCPTRAAIMALWC